MRKEILKSFKFFFCIDFKCIYFLIVKNVISVVNWIGEKYCLYEVKDNKDDLKLKSEDLLFIEEMEGGRGGVVNYFLFLRWLF